MKSQRKLDRYGRHAFYWKPCYRSVILSMAFTHFPQGLRQWAADQILLRVVALEYGVKP
jgi:hypothetical protein